MEAQPPLLAVTLGEPAGIGPDVLLGAWAASTAGRVTLPDFFVVGDASLLRERAGRLGIALSVRESAAPCRSDRKADLCVVPLSGRMHGAPGAPDARDGPLVIEAIDKAVRLVASKQAGAVVTGPIAKKHLYGSGFRHAGHTEYLGELAQRHFGESARPVMMIAGPHLRTVPVTIHVPLADVPAMLTSELIVETGRIVARDLAEKFGIAGPRLWVSGLNPHAGEGGAIGSEEREIIAPAVAALAAAGIAASGPYPADTMFHGAARARYDAAICMYHDQALIPAKALAFEEAVNVTLGLPFVRTSPDHGTAFDIAGTGKARPDSLIAAMRMAAQLAKRAANP